MKSVLGGGMENALIRETMVASGRVRPDLGHPYYMSLYRTFPRSYFERAGTFLAISDNTILPSVDWTSSMGEGDTAVSEEALGIERAPLNFGEWDKDVEIFVALALRLGAFSAQSARGLSDVLPPSPKPDSWRWPTLEIDGIGTVDYFALHQLCRLVAQIRTARETQSFLVLSDDDRSIVTELCEFAAAHSLPTPFDLPDLRSGQLLQGERFASGLLNFAPHDAKSIIAIRNDPGVEKYVRQVRQHMSAADGDAGLLTAMRDAMEDRDFTRQVRTAFEISSWVTKPLSYVPAVGMIVSVFSDLRDLLAKWMERRQSSEEWYLLGAKMQDIAVADYLKRMGNR